MERYRAGYVGKLNRDYDNPLNPRRSRIGKQVPEFRTDVRVADTDDKKKWNQESYGVTQGGEIYEGFEVELIMFVQNFLDDFVGGQIPIFVEDGHIPL